MLRADRKPAARIFLGCLLLLIVVMPFDEGGNGYIVQAFTHSSLLFCAVIWSVQTLRQGNAFFRVDPLDWMLTAALIWLAVNTCFSVYRYAAFLELVKICSYAGVFYLCRQLFPFRALRQLLLATLFTSSVLQMLIAWGWMLTERRPALQADFINPNNFACFMVCGVNIGLSILIFADPQRSRRHTQVFKIVIAILLCCLIGTIINGGSRGAILAFLGSGFFIFILKKRRLALCFLLLCCVGFFLPLPAGSIFERLQKKSDQFAYERIGIWKSSVAMARDNYLRGVGPGQFEYVSPAYNFPVERAIARYGKNINSAHNDLLQILDELGLPGLGLALGELGLVIVYALRRFRRKPYSWTEVAAPAVLLGGLLQGTFSCLLASPAIALVMTLACVLILESKPLRAPIALKFAVPKLCCLLTLLMAVYVLLYAIVYPLLGHRHYLDYLHLKEEHELLRAIPHLQAAIDTVPIHPLYFYELGRIYMEAFKKAPDSELFRGALDALDKAVRYNRRYYKFYETRAILYKELFKTLSPNRATAEKALREYELALQYNPFNPFLLFSRAMIYADIARFDAALEQLYQALAIEPNFVGGRQMIAKLLTRLGRETEAERFRQEAAELHQQYAARAAESHYTFSLLRSLE